MTTKKRKKKYLPMETGHPDRMEWEMQRFPGQWTKMVFHPRPGRPTEPNAGLVRYEPGAHHPYHTYDFAQVWYVLEGEFQMGGAAYGPGTMMFFPDPHYEDQLKTETGGVIVYMQTRGRRPRPAQSTTVASTSRSASRCPRNGSTSRAAAGHASAMSGASVCP